MRTSIWLVRHGQTEFNKVRRYQGATETALTPYGLRQAQALAHRLRRIPFTAAIISPSGRTRATAAAILAGRATPIIEDARWAETDHGRWEGLTYAEVRARFPAEAAARFADGLHGRAEGGESLADVEQRVTAAWQALLSEHSGGRVLLVAHATPIQLVLCKLNNLSPSEHWRWRIDLGSITALDLYGAATIVRVVNEVPRLQI